MFNILKFVHVIPQIWILKIKIPRHIKKLIPLRVKLSQNCILLNKFLLLFCFILGRSTIVVRVQKYIFVVLVWGLDIIWYLSVIYSFSQHSVLFFCVLYYFRFFRANKPCLSPIHQFIPFWASFLPISQLEATSTLLEKAARAIFCCSETVLLLLFL